jgi:predicted DNA-binding protein (MmcQ/YjbR family)
VERPEVFENGGFFLNLPVFRQAANAVRQEVASRIPAGRLGVIDMMLEAVRSICLAFPGATEDVKWGADLAFCVGGKMFCVVYLEPPHPMSFKCSAEDFAGLIERPGLRPAPYLARAMWIQEEVLGEALERFEVERLLRASYDLVAAGLPGLKRGSKQPMTARAGAPRTRPSRHRTRASAVTRRRRRNR